MRVVVQKLCMTEQMATLEETLTKLYSDPGEPASFAGISATYAALRNEKLHVSRQNVEDYLNNKDSYTLHKPTRRKFPRRRTIVSSIGDQMQADLMSMENLSRYNDGYRFILLSIDILSRKLYGRALKDKRGISVRDGLSSIFQESSPPTKFQTDEGKEFLNHHVTDLMSTHNVKHFTTHSENKCSIIERSIRTLRQKIYRYMTEKKTKYWVDILPAIISSYNNSYHRSIPMCPAQVCKANQKIVWRHLYGRPFPSKPPRFKLNDQVRISVDKGTFEKGAEENFSREIFRIVDIRHDDQGPPTYKIIDKDSELILGSFYEPQLTKVHKSHIDKTYRIEKIIRTKGRGNSQRLYVKWLNYPASYNSWIKKSDLENE